MRPERSTRSALEAAVERIIAAHDDPPPAPAPPRPAPRRGRGALGCVVVVAVLMRLVLVVAPPADGYPVGLVIEDGVVIEEGRRVAGEELLRGSATQDFIEGTVLPHLQDYQVQPFWGGTLVVSILAVPFFAVLGPTIVALRLTGVVFAAIVAAASFWILDRFASRRAAWIGGLLMATAPPGLAVFGATAFGAEAENLSFALLALAAYLAWVHGGLRAWPGFLAGALSGFAIYCGYIVLPLVGLLVLHALWLDPRFLRRRATWCAVAGFVIGLWPAIHYNLTHAWGGLLLYGESLTDHIAPGGGARRLVEHALDLAWWDLPGAFYLRPPLRFELGRVVLLVFVLLALAAAIAQRASLARALRPPWRRSEPGFDAVHPTVLFLAFLPLYALAYLVTDFRVNHRIGTAIAYRYALPFFPILFLLAGIGLDALARRSAALRRASLGVAAALCGLFLVSNLAYCRFERVRENWSTPGTSDVQFARSIMLRYGGDLDALTYVSDAVARKKTPAVQEKLFFVIAQNYKYFLHESTPLDERHRALLPDYARALEHLRASAPEPYRAFFEPLAPGERVFAHHEIDAWRRARAARAARDADGG